ncbi:hypothetical protein ACQ4PT_066593 [Festuca glaucescens]
MVEAAKTTIRASEMNGRARRPAAAHGHGAKAAPKGDMQKEQRKAMPVKGPASAVTRGVMNRIQSRRERKLALQQDVDKLKKKLRHEENVHRALERAFTRPLGALPRLPPYLPSQTLALLAEVAVLEEEVVRLEEQVVNFRQGIYQEAIIFSSSAKNMHLPGGGEGCVPPQLVPSSPTPLNSEFSPTVHHGSDRALVRPSPNGKQTPRKPNPASGSQDDGPGSGSGKENQSCINSWLSPSQKVTKSRVPAAAPEKRRAAQMISAVPDRKGIASNNSGKVSQDGSNAPNRLSEELLSCLLTIFSQMGSLAAPAGSGQDEEQQPLSPSVSGSCESSSEDAYPQDPYGILELGARDVGPYKWLHVIDAASFDRNALASNTLLARRLKALLRKLASVDLAGLSHHHKLAFWINVYNSCMMNAFLEQGVPTTPHMLVAMMPKAAIEVGGRTHSAMSIEHFVLRLPYSVKHVEGTKGGDAVAGAGAFGLEWPEPLVRVYTAARVEEELEGAKRDYLQAAVAVSAPERLAIPKLLHWYLLDFAKDVDSLMDWVCLQLPRELRQSAMRAVDEGRHQRGAGAVDDAPRMQVLPYEFRFRYLLAS